MSRFASGLALIVTMHFAACSSDPTTRDSAPPNVIIIVSDALRQDVIGCYGGEARTPNIDALAQAGVLFENAYANSPWTAPSSVTMLTGNYATAYAYSPFAGTIQIHVPDREIQLAEALREAGYATLAKIDNVHGAIHNNLQGFDLLPDGRLLEQVTTKPVRDRVAQITNERVNQAPYWHLGVVLARLLEIPEDRAFFILYWMVDPHEPYAPVARFKERIRMDPWPLPNPPSFYEESRLRMNRLSAAEQAYVKRLYVAEVESVDERVGFIIDMLRHKNILDDTHIVFTSDHGELFGEHGQWGHHGYFYEDATRIPLIMAGPELPKGKRESAPVSLVDLMPTLKDLLGVAYDADMQGASVRSLMLGESQPDRYVYFPNIKRQPEANAPHVEALLKDGFKLVSVENGEFDLYNVIDDAGETQDVGDRYPGVAATLRGLMDAQREHVTARATLNASEPAETIGKNPEATEEILKQLKALGYIK